MHTDPFDTNYRVATQLYNSRSAADKKESTASYAHAVRYIMPLWNIELTEPNKKAQVRDTIQKLESYLDGKRQQKCSWSFFVTTSNKKEFVIEGLAQWYSYNYEVPEEPQSAFIQQMGEQLNYAPSESIDNTDKLEMLLHRQWKLLSLSTMTDEAKVFAIMDFKTSLQNTPAYQM